MIVGSVELEVRALSGGFSEQLTKGTVPASDKAGAQAGKAFSSAFVKGASGISSTIQNSGKEWAAAARDWGKISGLEFAQAYRKAAQAAMSEIELPVGQVVTQARAGGAETGEAFASGIQGQMSLFGDEGLEAGRAFSRSFVEGTVGVDTAAAEEGTAAGAAFGRGFSEAAKTGMGGGAIIDELGNVSIVTESEAAGAASGAAFSRGQRRGITTGSVETSLMPTWGRIGETAEAAGLSTGSRFSAAMGKGVGVGVALVVAGAAYMAGEFQQKTNVLVTAAGEDVRALGAIRQGILDISTTTGTGWKDLVDGEYQVEKAGYRGADSLVVLRAAAEAAREENADLATVTSATTSVMASYHLGVGQAVGVTNAIKTAAGESKTTMEAFAGALSTVLPVASANHIAFSDVAGAIATLTQHGTSAAEATQELSNTIRNLAAPNAVASKEMAQLGINSNEVSQSLGTRGLTGTLDFLSETVLRKMGPSGLLLLNTFNQSKIAAQAAQTEFDAMGPAAQRLAQGFKDGTTSVADYRKAARALPGEQGVLAMQFFQTYSNAMGFQNALKQGGPAAQTYSAAIKAMTGGANGLNTTLQITGESLAGTEDRTRRIADAMKAGGQNVQGWESTQKLFNVQMDIAKQRMSAAAITAGTTLLPALGALVRPLGMLATAWGEGVAATGRLLTPIFRDLGTQLADFGRTIKPVFDAIRDSPLFKPAMLVLLGALVSPVLILAGAVKLIGLSFEYLINPIAHFVSTLISEPSKAFGQFKQAADNAIGFVKRAWDDLLGGFQNPGASIDKAIDGFDHFFLSLGERIRRLPGDIFDFGAMLGRAWGRMLADVPHWVGDLFSALSKVDWGHVAVVIGNALLDGIKAIWRNKKTIAEVGLAIVGGIVAAFFAIPAALIGVGVLLVGGLVVGIARGLAGAAGAVGRFFARMWNDAAGFAGRMADDVGRFFSRMWSDVTGFTSRIWHDVTGFFSRIYHDVTGAVGSAVDFVGRHWRLLLVIFTGPIGFAIDLVNHFWQQISGFFSRMWRDVSGFAGRMWRDVTGWFSRMANDVSASVRYLWSTVTAYASRIWRDVSGWFARMWRDVTGWTSRMWHDVAGWFARMWADVTGWTSRTWRDVTNWFSRMWRDTTGLASRIWHDIAGFFARLWSDVTGWTSRIWHDVTGYFDRTRDHTVGTANDLWHRVMTPFRAMWQDLENGFNTVVGAIERAWNRLENIFKVPINFFIDPVYNRGVVPVWNFVMDVVGEPSGKLKPVAPLAEGGGLSGPWRGDDRYVMAGGGEHYWTAEEVAAAGGHDRVAAMRAAIVGHPVRVMGDGSGRYADGGGWTPSRILHDVTHNPVTNAAGSALHAITHNPVTDAIGGVVKDLASMVRGAAADVAAPALNAAASLLDSLIGTTGGKWGHEVGQIGHQTANKMIDWIRGQDAKDSAAMSGGLAGGGPISWNGGSVTVGLIEQLARTLPFGNAMTVTSTTGGGHAANSYHYKGEAVDFSNGTGNTPQMLAFDRAWAQKYGSSLAELIYTAPGSVFIDNGNIVGPGTFSSVLDEHRNHVHVAISPESIARGHQNFLPFGNTGGPAGETGIVQAVHAAAAARGWGGQLAALDSVIQRESSWNPNVKNPRSTAYGLFQMLTERPGTGVQQQTTDGLNYIAGRYQNPTNAAAHEAHYGWYDQGGYLPPGGGGQPSITVAANGTGRVERILNADETEAYEAGQRSAGGRGKVTVNQTNHLHGVDLTTAQTLTGRQLALAVQKAGI